MRAYVSPIGYDTRRVTKPVVSTGLDGNDQVILLRPETESDTERATQAITDVEQFLHELEPNVQLRTERVATDSFEETVHGCLSVLASIEQERETVVSLGGGARDVLLPLTVASLVCSFRIDRALFFSDLDSTVQEWPLPDLTAAISERAVDTFAVVIEAADWLTLSDITDRSAHSKSTVIRHINELEDEGLVESDTSNRAKRVRPTFTGELLSVANSIAQ